MAAVVEDHNLGRHTRQRGVRADHGRGRLSPITLGVWEAPPEKQNTRSGDQEIMKLTLTLFEASSFQILLIF